MTSYHRIAKPFLLGFLLIRGKNWETAFVQIFQQSGVGIFSILFKTAQWVGGIFDDTLCLSLLLPGKTRFTSFFSSQKGFPTYGFLTHGIFRVPGVIISQVVISRSDQLSPVVMAQPVRDGFEVDIPFDCLTCEIGSQGMLCVWANSFLPHVVSSAFWPFLILMVSASGFWPSSPIYSKKALDYGNNRIFRISPFFISCAPPCIRRLGRLPPNSTSFDLTLIGSFRSIPE